MLNRLKYICLLSLLFALPIAAQQQWYFSVDERYPAVRSDLRATPRVMVVNNALVQPQDFGHTTIVDGDSQSNIEVDLSRSIL